MTADALRPPAGTDARAWTREVFAAGDYAGAAMYGDPSTWELHGARALLLGDRESFAALVQFDAPEARFHAAAAHWIHGDTDRARRELAGLDLPHARNLARLVSRDRIQVLAQLPWLPGAMTDLRSGTAADRQFEVRCLGHRTGDLPNRPYADVRRCLDDGFAPDFFVAAMVEWHHVPPNLQALACPLFGHVADHDLHVQTIRPWLDLFDELCVTDRTEWLDVMGLSRGTVSSFPKVFGLPASLPPLHGGDRHLDFFVSGTMLDPYHPDKARVLHELLAMPDIDLRVVRGFTGPLAFHALLAASKASFTFVRRPGALPTRGLESLALGCAVALQQESVLRLWVGENEGALPYGPNDGDLARAVRRLVDDWQHFGPAARRGAELVRTQFAMPRVASQYLRFLTFRAAAKHAPRQVTDTSSWCQKRLCVSRTWLPDDPMVRRRTMQANFRQLGEVVARRPGAGPIVDMARELLCEFVFYEQRDQVEADERALLDDAVRLLEKCCRSFPDHLAARFLLVRTLWHHGDAAARERAMQLAREALDVGPERWQIGPDDDVMPFDFHADTFDYRAYLDRVAAAAKGRAVAKAEYVRLIRASFAGYLGRTTGTLAFHELAVSLDPGFARYRLDLAKCLLARGPGGDAVRARQLLQELAAGSAEFAAAAEILQREGLSTGPALAADTERALRRLQQDTIDAGVDVQSLFRVERREARAARSVREQGPGTSLDAGVSVLVPGVTGERDADLLAELEGQTCAGALAVVVALSPEQAHLAASLLSSTTLRCLTVPVATRASWAERLNACVAAADAPYVTVSMPGDRWRPDAFEVLRAELDECGDAAVAFGNEGWTEGPVARFDPSACLGFRCPPPFAHRRLRTTNGIGGHAMWRRSLHQQHGGFDPRFGAATEYEFWLRATQDAQARQLPLLLTTSSLRSPWRAMRDPASDLPAAERARARHVPGIATPFRPQQVLPATLLAPGLREEAVSHARLGVIGDAQRRDLASLEQFLGTALLHGDTDTALCLLRAAIACAPRLLAPRLLLADLTAALGGDARDVLLAARAHHPYENVIDRRLAAVLPTSRTPTDPSPCLA